MGDRDFFSARLDRVEESLAEIVAMMKADRDARRGETLNPSGETLNPKSDDARRREAARCTCAGSLGREDARRGGAESEAAQAVCGLVAVPPLILPGDVGRAGGNDTAGIGGNESVIVGGNDTGACPRAAACGGELSIKHEQDGPAASWVGQDESVRTGTVGALGGKNKDAIAETEKGVEQVRAKDEQELHLKTEGELNQSLVKLIETQDNLQERARTVSSRLQEVVMAAEGGLQLASEMHASQSSPVMRASLLENHACADARGGGGGEYCVNVRGQRRHFVTPCSAPGSSSAESDAYAPELTESPVLSLRAAAAAHSNGVNGTSRAPSAPESGQAMYVEPVSPLLSVDGRMLRRSGWQRSGP